MTNRVRLLFVMVCGVVALTVTPVSAQPLDCAKAKSNVEKLVCSDKALAAANAKMAKLYRLNDVGFWSQTETLAEFERNGKRVNCKVSK